MRRGGVAVLEEFNHSIVSHVTTKKVNALQEQSNGSCALPVCLRTCCKKERDILLLKTRFSSLMLSIQQWNYIASWHGLIWSETNGSTNFTHKPVENLNVGL